MLLLISPFFFEDQCLIDRLNYLHTVIAEYVTAVSLVRSSRRLTTDTTLMARDFD